MRIKQLPEDFQVEEQIAWPGDDGPFAYYRVQKRGLTTVAVRDAMAARLKVTPSALVFPALKDKAAVTVQYACVRKRGPEVIQGEGYEAARVGWGPRALRPSDLAGNLFVVTVRDLDDTSARDLAPAMEKLGRYGLPNYFDDQRFGSLTRDGFIGKEILKRDAERVVHMYLAESMAGDRREIRKFKRLVASHWGEWGFLLHQAPRPSNYRSVITYLKDHPHEYRTAANLIQDRLLSIYLAAYQSWVWNHIVGTYLEQKHGSPHRVRIVRSRFAVPEPCADVWALRDVLVDLPRLTAHYAPDFSAAAAAVFVAEGLDLHDFKARILRRVYLTKGERQVVFAPTAVGVGESEEDEENPGKRQVQVRFALDAGRYATLILKVAAALIGADILVR
ncbi:MAG: tRNA pseudouridine(13) synthase TruD [Anaerolineae bacterium]|nr:tRNA pseudouridine(13) synthase TruD [Anaerolineae bacterium]